MTTKTTFSAAEAPEYLLITKIVTATDVSRGALVRASEAICIRDSLSSLLSISAYPCMNSTSIEFQNYYNILSNPFTRPQVLTNAKDEREKLQQFAHFHFAATSGGHYTCMKWYVNLI